MQSGLIVTCPTHDDATAYLTHFSKSVISEAIEKSLKNKIIENKELNIDSFTKILNKLDYKLIFINGHGSEDSIFGYKDNIILKLGTNDKLIKERIVYARSCHAGITLGPECMKNTREGCFIGYTLPFIFYMDEKWTTKPNNDNIAKLFLEPSNLIPISIIKGHSTLEAYNNSKRQMLKIMNKLMKNNDEQETPFYLEALWNNYIGQDIFGNNEAKL